MLLLLVICPIALTLAVPASKYPYQYLLKDGNVELDKTNTEQIKLVLPGGSLAIRYPAVGYGAEIVHIKVDAVDYGSNVRAKIIEGGPGFNYVVLTLFGQPKLPYKAFVNIYTTKENNSPEEGTKEISNSINTGDPYGVENDSNDSAEDTSNVWINQYRDKMNQEMVQRSNGEELKQESSSNIYSYSANEVPCDGNDDVAYKEDNRQNTEESAADKDSADGTTVYKESDYDEDGDDGDGDGVGNVDDDGGVVSEDYQENQEPAVVDRNLYNMYQILKSHLNVGNILPQDEYNKQKEAENGENEALEEVFSDGELHNRVVDPNNNSDNNFDVSDASAVDY